jgi:protein-L-isoaspartate(D-aspartate) O-methyltransferase
MSRRVLLLMVLLAACDKGHKAPPAQERAKPVVVQPKEPDVFTAARNEMVSDQIEARGIKDEKVLTAMRLVPRHAFVPPSIRDHAYDDRALGIGFDKTISQPFIIATMTEALHVNAGDKVLEIGTGSGYQAAVLAMMGAKVYTMEIAEDLEARTKEVLKAAGFSQVNIKAGDGYFGWPDAAPFDAILVTCAAPELPDPLLDQLKPGGRLVIVLGDEEQVIVRYVKTDTGLKKDVVMDSVMFGPMTGEIAIHRHVGGDP